LKKIFPQFFFNKNGEQHMKEQDKIFSAVYRLPKYFLSEHDKKLGESYMGKTHSNSGP
jgi:hypothetical protein